jgi:hypothetical protein
MTSSLLPFPFPYPSTAIPNSATVLPSWCSWRRRETALNNGVGVGRPIVPLGGGGLTGKREYSEETCPMADNFIRLFLLLGWTKLTLQFRVVQIFLCLSVHLVACLCI